MSVSDVGAAQNQTTRSAAQGDAEQERLLFQLVGELEQILVRMDEISETKRLPGSIEIGKEMLVELVEFSEARYDKSLTRPLFNLVCDFHEKTKRFEKMHGGQSWNGFAALIGIKMSYSDEAKAMFQELGRDLLEVVGGFFDLFESRFSSADQSSEWHANSQVLLDDLVHRWNMDGTRR